MQALLLGLGTLLLAVAAVVFTAVNWSRMDAASQGIVLLLLTAGSAGATGAAVRRGLTATAEALGLVSVVLALVDVHAIRITSGSGSDPLTFWAAGLVVVSAAAWLLARTTGVRSTQVVAVALAQVPMVLVLLATRPGLAASTVAMLLQVSVILVATAPNLSVGRALDGTTRSWALGPAASTWLAVTAAVAVQLTVDGARANPSLVYAVALASAVALLAAACFAHLDGARDLALAAATTTGLASVGWQFRLVADRRLAWALLGLVSAAVVGGALRLPRRWGSVPAWSASAIAVLVGWAITVPIGEVIVRLGDVASVPWAGVASDRAISRSSIAHGASHPWALAVHLIGIGLLLAALSPQLGRRRSAVAVSALSVASAALAPLLLPLSIGGAAAIGCLAATAALLLTEAILRRESDEAVARSILCSGTGTAAALLLLAGSWSTATRPLSIVTVALVVLGAAWLVMRAWWVQDIGLARVATGAAVLAFGVEAALVASAAGASPATSLAAAGAAGLTAATIALLALPAALARGGEVAGWALHVFALVAVLVGADGGASDAVGSGGSHFDAAWRITLLSGALAAAARCGRRPAASFAALAAAEGLALWWLELAIAEVLAPEPYTLPLAAVLAAAGVVAERRASVVGERLGSWATAGPALLVAAVPTVWVSLLEPSGPRPLSALVVSMVVLAAGAFSGRRALVDVGAASVAILGLARLLPVLAAAPNWAVIGLTGTILLAVGATFEERRRDARGVRDRYSALQ